jgi:hypothetical protein
VDPVTISDAAMEFQIGRMTLYRLINKHGLKKFKKPGDRRTWIDREALRPLLSLQEKVKRSARRR